MGRMAHFIAAHTYTLEGGLTLPTASPMLRRLHRTHPCPPQQHSLRHPPLLCFTPQARQHHSAWHGFFTAAVISQHAPRQAQSLRTSIECQTMTRHPVQESSCEKPLACSTARARHDAASAMISLLGPPYPPADGAQRATPCGSGWARRLCAGNRSPRCPAMPPIPARRGRA